MSVFSNFPIYFHIDGLGLLFATLTLIIFLLSGMFQMEYMKGEKHIVSYNIFYVLAMTVEILLCFAGNMITFYMCFELLTVMSMPLVIQERTRESIMAALKYLFFSLFGAYSALFGIYILNKYADSLVFTAGGTLSEAVFDANSGVLLLAAFLLIIGFGVKAGMWPMHSWLPTAHPVAPAPASAVLSAVIVKAGVLGIIRSLFYIFDADLLSGSVIQKAWMILTLLTVFMGSMLAYREPVLKKRLAYSTVSQVSYILFGLSVLDPIAMEGALLHVIGHGLIKAGLFLVAGAIIHNLGVTKVSEMRGVGRRMPITMICYTLLSHGLLGIPPMGGFISKWYLCIGALDSDIKVFSVLGPVILLISALLTAGYLLELAFIGFFPGADYGDEPKCEPKSLMLIPIVALTLCSVLMGLFPGTLTGLIEQIVYSLIDVI